MGVNLGVTGCRYANLKLTAILEDSRHNKNKLYYMFTEFTLFPLRLIVKTIDIFPICPILRRMWKETAFDNHVRLIKNGEASELISTTRRVA
jgi:hypothetical protein